MFGTIVATGVGLSLLAIGIQEAVDARVDQRRLMSLRRTSSAKPVATTVPKADAREIPFELPKAA